jgi:hypothetical protein
MRQIQAFRLVRESKGKKATMPNRSLSIPEQG